MNGFWYGPRTLHAQNQLFFVCSARSFQLLPRILALLSRFETDPDASFGGYDDDQLCVSAKKRVFRMLLFPRTPQLLNDALFLDLHPPATAEIGVEQTLHDHLHLLIGVTGSFFLKSLSQLRSLCVGVLPCRISMREVRIGKGSIGGHSCPASIFGGRFQKEERFGGAWLSRSRIW